MTRSPGSALTDARSRRVVFVSHCLLNQNVRYLGGASHAGIVPTAIDPFIRDGIGIYQMPCPEQIAWGGVTKRFVANAYGSAGTLVYRFRNILLPLVMLYTRAVYRRIARRVARHIADYVRSGYEVVGIVGVGDSPSCGVTHTLDMRRALPVVASFDMGTIDRETFNELAIRQCRIEGQGIYVRALRRELGRRELSIPFLEHDPGSRTSRSR